MSPPPEGVVTQSSGTERAKGTSIKVASTKDTLMSASGVKLRTSLPERKVKNEYENPARSAKRTPSGLTDTAPQPPNSNPTPTTAIAVALYHRAPAGSRLKRI